MIIAFTPLAGSQREGDRTGWTSPPVPVNLRRIWLCTKHGFYSIVQKESGEFHIRARVGADLDNLKALAGLKAKVIETKDADYRYRLVVGREEALAAIARLAEDIDYSNFKGRIASDPAQRDKLGAYHEIWGLMHGIQRRAEKTAI